jgi:hypothetical protein
MIQSGGWSGFRTIDEHTKLARISVSFAPSLDEAFKINVAKMRVQLPSIIKEEVLKSITSVVKTAREIYDRKEIKTLTGSSKKTSQATTAVKNERIYDDKKHGPEVLSFKQWAQQIILFATSKEREVINALLSRFQRERGASKGTK